MVTYGTKPPHVVDGNCRTSEPVNTRSVADPDSDVLVAETATEVYGQPMKILPMVGGSGPNHAFIHELNVPVATGGLGYPDTRAHAPDENIRIDLYLQHARHVARLLEAFGESTI